MRCLEKLIEMGYEIGIKNGDFFYKATNQKLENSNLLKPIFIEIKSNKEKIIRFLKYIDKFQHSQATNAVWNEYRILNESRVKGGWMVSEVMKGLHSGENIYEIFLKAMNCIGKLTDDEITPEVAKKDLIAIYGYTPPR